MPTERAGEEVVQPLPDEPEVYEITHCELDAVAGGGPMQGGYNRPD